jgi:phosphocarrier protein
MVEFFYENLYIFLMRTPGHWPYRGQGEEEKMVEMRAKVQNDGGIHCRPSGLIFKAVEKYKGNITLISKEMETPLCSIMDIIVLGLIKDDEITIRVSGEHEDLICGKLKELFETKFDFPQKKECKAH